MRRALAILLLMAPACTPAVLKISGRNPDLFEKESERLEGRSRGDSEGGAPEVYVKEKSIAIKDAARPNETGSLFNPEDERNYLFTQTGPLNVGRFLKIRVTSNHGDNKKKDEAAEKAKAAAAAKPAKD